MSFDETLNQTIEMLRRNKRVSYRALRRQFGIDDVYVDDLKAEIVEVLKLGVDEGGQVLVWTGPEAAPVPLAAPGPIEPKPPEPKPPEPKPSESKPPEPKPRALEGERRHLTVMFCDLVDSTPLAERHDPEDLADIYAAWQDACADAVKAESGHISDYRGDGVFVYFGYPAAYEDAPHRAVRAALGLLERLKDVNAKQIGRAHV